MVKEDESIIDSNKGVISIYSVFDQLTHVHNHYRAGLHARIDNMIMMNVGHNYRACPTKPQLPMQSSGNSKR